MTASAQINVETAVGRRDLDVKRLCHAINHLGERPGHVKSMVHGGGQHGTTIDRHNVVSPIRRKPHLEHVVRLATGMEHRASTTVPMGIHKIVEGRVNFGLCQRIVDEAAFPRAIVLWRQVLHGAAATDSKMSADRREALRAPHNNPHHVPPVVVTRERLDLDGLAWQRIGHVERAGRRIGNTVAAMSEAIDDEEFGHIKTNI